MFTHQVAAMRFFSPFPPDAILGPAGPGEPPSAPRSRKTREMSIERSIAARGRGDPGFFRRVDRADRPIQQPGRPGKDVTVYGYIVYDFRIISTERIQLTLNGL